MRIFIRFFLQITWNLLDVQKQKIFESKNHGTHKYSENFSKAVMIGTSAYRGFKLTSISSNKLQQKANWRYLINTWEIDDVIKIDLKWVMTGVKTLEKWFLDIKYITAPFIFPYLFKINFQSKKQKTSKSILDKYKRVI